MPYVNNRYADQPAHPRSLIRTFVVRYLDSIIPILAESKISSLQLVSVAKQAGLSLTWSETPKTGFLVTRFRFNQTFVAVGSDTVHLDRFSCSASVLFKSLWSWLTWLVWRSRYDPAHEIMALFVLRKLILQSRMRSHPVGLDVRLFGRTVYFHTQCVRTANAGETAHMRTLA